MPEGKRIRGNTIGVPSQNALPHEVYQSSRRGATCDRRFHAFHLSSIITKRQNVRNPRGVVRRTRVLFGSCTVCRLVHVLVPLRTSSRHFTIQAKARRMTPENFYKGFAGCTPGAFLSNSASISSSVFPFVSGMKIVVAKYTPPKAANERKSGPIPHALASGRNADARPHATNWLEKSAIAMPSVFAKTTPAKAAKTRPIPRNSWKIAVPLPLRSGGSVSARYIGIATDRNPQLRPCRIRPPMMSGNELSMQRSCFH